MRAAPRPGRAAPCEARPGSCGPGNRAGGRVHGAPTAPRRAPREEPRRPVPPRGAGPGPSVPRIPLPPVGFVFPYGPLGAGRAPGLNERGRRAGGAAPVRTPGSHLGSGALASVSPHPVRPGSGSSPPFPSLQTRGRPLSLRNEPPRGAVGAARLRTGGRAPPARCGAPGAGCDRHLSAEGGGWPALPPVAAAGRKGAGGRAVGAERPSLAAAPRRPAPRRAAHPQKPSSAPRSCAGATRVRLLPPCRGPARALRPPLLPRDSAAEARRSGEWMLRKSKEAVSLFEGRV